MANKKLFTITDLGGGDGGKGGVVHKVCTQNKAHTVLKVGGAQGSHGVKTAAGESFNFSQFGCGTLEGVATHITSLMVVEPLGLLHEADLLRYEHGVSNVFGLLTIDGDALCITPFHGLASQLQELARKDKPKGTIGIGAGVAVVDSQRYPELAIYVKDLAKPGLREKLAAVREQKIRDLAVIVNTVSELLPNDQQTAAEIIRTLADDRLVSRITEQFQRLASSVRIVDREHLSWILHQPGTVVVESSHGVLTDRMYGFSPNTSRLRTVPNVTWGLIRDLDYNGQIFKLGVTRAYQIRHGAGPMVTENPAWVKHLLPGSCKAENRWQGKVRVGPLDFVALRYAVNVCGGPEIFDGLVVTWFDQIPALGKWDVCESYHGCNDPDFFTPSGEIIVSHKTGEEQLQRQERLGQKLHDCLPNISSHRVDSLDTKGLVDLCSTVCGKQLHIPLKMISLGPTEDDKLCL